MNIILDIALIVIVMLFIFSGYKHGFVKTVLSFFSLVIAFFTAKYFSPSLSDYLYGKFIKPNFVDKVLQDLAGIIGKGVENLNLNKLITEQPNAFINKVTSYGSSVEEMKNWVDGAVANGASNVNEAVANNLVTPVAKNVSDFVAFILVFAAAMLLCKILVVVIDHVFKLPGLNLINKIGGVLLGIIIGLVWAYIFVFLASLILPYFVSQQGITSAAEVINDTIFFKWLYEHSPITYLSGLFLK